MALTLILCRLHWPYREHHRCYERSQIYLTNRERCRQVTQAPVALCELTHRPGGKYAETTDRSTSVLICHAEATDWQKPIYARDRQIPVVTLDWFLHSVASGSKRPFREFALPDKTWQNFSFQRRHEEGKARQQQERAQKTASSAEPISR